MKDFTKYTAEQYLDAWRAKNAFIAERKFKLEFVYKGFEEIREFAPVADIVIAKELFSSMTITTNNAETLKVLYDALVHVATIIEGKRQDRNKSFDEDYACERGISFSFEDEINSTLGVTIYLQEETDGCWVKPKITVFAGTNYGNYEYPHKIDMTTFNFIAQDGTSQPLTWDYVSDKFEQKSLKIVELKEKIKKQQREKRKHLSDVEYYFSKDEKQS